MTILYALVSRGKTVLAEYTDASGNFQTITRVLLGKIPENEDGKMSYVYDQHVFHYIVENRVIYLCMCDEINKRRVPFSFLDDVKQRFDGIYGEQAHTAIAFAFNAEFSPVLMERMGHFNNPSSDAFEQVNNKLHDVKEVMVKNVEMVLERGEKLELLVDKTDQLNQQAFRFERTSRHLKAAMFWRKVSAPGRHIAPCRTAPHSLTLCARALCCQVRLYAAAVLVACLVVWIISASVCGIDYGKCSASSGSGHRMLRVRRLNGRTSSYHS